MKTSLVEKLKIVIWDLDDTFWEGTLSEEAIRPIEKNAELVRALARRGVVSAICSNNDHETVRLKLQEMGLWEYFVFPAISWGPKGPAVKALLENAQLRAPNALFLDDRERNLAEVRDACPGIAVALPTSIPTLYAETMGHEESDPELSRLARYHVLETKHEEQVQAIATGATREDFLRGADIELLEVMNTWEHLDRIHELISRTNQLNFTKKRDSLEEVRELLRNDDYDCKAFVVRDRFGDYGISGFYALDTVNRKLEHFVFSCRSMNMGIEQWLYRYLKDPIFASIGSPWDNDFETPDWIAFGKTMVARAQEGGPAVLLRGGCMLDHVTQDIANALGCSPVLDLKQWSSHSSSLRVNTQYEGDVEELEGVITGLSGDSQFPSRVATDRAYDFVVMELSKDYRCEVYDTGTGVVFPIAPVGYDLTDPSVDSSVAEWRSYGTGLAGPWDTNIYSPFGLEFIRQNTERLPEAARHARFEDDVTWYVRHLRQQAPDTVLAFLLNSTHAPSNLYSCWRHVPEQIRLMNPILERIAAREGVAIVRMDDYMQGPEDFTFDFNPFIMNRKVATKVAEALVAVYQNHKASDLKKSA